MKARALLLVAVLAQPAFAECYLRSSTLNQFKGTIERTADVARDVVVMPPDKMQCTVTFRVMLNGVWHTAQGQAIGLDSTSENQLCAQAQDIGRSRLMQKIDGSQTSVSQEMVCTDQDIPQTRSRPVKIGDLVRESEMAPHWDLSKRTSFAHRGLECRWFMETLPYGVSGMVQSIGMMCKLDNNRWRITDKWINSIDK